MDLTLMVTGLCNLSCPLCSQQEWRARFEDYQMEPSEVNALLASAAAQGVRVGTVHVAGGEPTLWEHFEDGLVAVKESRDAPRVCVSSNCVEFNRLIAAMEAGLVDAVYCQLSNASRKGMEQLRRTHPKRLHVGRRTEHRARPLRQQRGVLPARCGCARPAYFEGYIYQCADIYPNVLRLGMDFKSPVSRWPLAEGTWVRDYRRAHPTRHPACACCLANRKVWEKLG